MLPWSPLGGLGAGLFTLKAEVIQMYFWMLNSNARRMPRHTAAGLEKTTCSPEWMGEILRRELPTIAERKITYAVHPLRAADVPEEDKAAYRERLAAGRDVRRDNCPYQVPGMGAEHWWVSKRTVHFVFLGLMNADLMEKRPAGDRCAGNALYINNQLTTQHKLHLFRRGDPAGAEAGIMLTHAHILYIQQQYLRISRIEGCPSESAMAKLFSKAFAVHPRRRSPFHDYPVDLLSMPAETTHLWAQNMCPRLVTQIKVSMLLTKDHGLGLDQVRGAGGSDFGGLCPGARPRPSPPGASGGTSWCWSACPGSGARTRSATWRTCT